VRDEAPPNGVRWGESAGEAVVRLHIWKQQLVYLSSLATLPVVAGNVVKP
jgi:hypothetical protein